jgi:hypothetical protein
MSYREVSVIEIVEMLRLWLQGWGLREVARLSGTDRKTVRRYVDRARACGLDRDGGDGQLTDELIAAVIAGVRPSRPTGKSLPWETIAAERQRAMRSPPQLQGHNPCRRWASPPSDTPPRTPLHRCARRFLMTALRMSKLHCTLRGFLRQLGGKSE